ncbi:hypothetical protein GCM10023152_17220 [Agromyces bauzanensis]|uniref:Uncharacterized protein n=1 Tax=Agromyces bauzanensis TaxID=1308924 RepID=A0A917UWP4_9MICO|nr:hypothetical protein GCM10011372_31960 [Agromyces bauzanensis]
MPFDDERTTGHADVHEGAPRTIRAAVLHDEESRLRVIDIDVPVPKQGEALVKVVACGVEVRAGPVDERARAGQERCELGVDVVLRGLEPSARRVLEPALVGPIRRRGLPAYRLSRGIRACSRTRAQPRVGSPLSRGLVQYTELVVSMMNS